MVRKAPDLRHIISILFLAIFLLKGVAGIIPSSFNGHELAVLATGSEPEESKNAPESKQETGPNEFFLSPVACSADIFLFPSQHRNVIAGNSPVQPGYGSVPTPPPDPRLS